MENIGPLLALRCLGAGQPTLEGWREGPAAPVKRFDKLGVSEQPSRRAEPALSPPWSVAKMAEVAARGRHWVNLPLIAETCPVHRKTHLKPSMQVADLQRERPHKGYPGRLMFCFFFFKAGRFCFLFLYRSSAEVVISVLL